MPKNATVLSPLSNQTYSLSAKMDKHDKVAKPWNFNPPGAAQKNVVA